MSNEHLDLEPLLDRSIALLDVPAGASFLPWRLRPLSVEAFADLSTSGARLSRAQLAYLAWLDLLAPTSHNTVPQRFRLEPDDGALSLWLDRAFVLAASDPLGRQALVSLGCGIANAMLAARCYGWQASVDVEPVPVEWTRPFVEGEPRYTRVARLRFEPGAPSLPHDWLQAMLARKVVRAEYDERVKLDAELVTRAHALVAEHPGLELHLLTDAATLLFLGKFQELADTTVFNRDAFALELGAWLLENGDPSSLGMRGAEFGLSDEAARHIHEGLLRMQTLLPDEMAAFAKAGNLGMRSSSAVAVITVDEDSVAQRVAAGRAYEELCLLLLQHRFCTAMHAGITEVDAPNLALRGRLRTRRRPTVVFRIGRPLHEADWLRPHSARPSLDAVLLPDDFP
jgi:hypothetical protein